MKKQIKSLYLSYDGMTDALGESQVLSYLIGLSQKGIQITLISFEKEIAYQNKKNRIQELCEINNINWIPLRYTPSPPVFSTLYDVYKLKKAISSLESKFDLVHCRGYITSIVGKQLKLQQQIPFIFDMRGFWADEKLESGNWSGTFFKPVYNYFKKKEKQFFEESDYIVSLTKAGKKEINQQFNIPNTKIKTIPTCVNQELFTLTESTIKSKIREELNIEVDEKVMVYSGSLGGNYNINILIDAFSSFLKAYPKSKLLILTKTLEESFPEIDKTIKSKMIFQSLPYHEVGNYLSIADLGFVFYKKGFSTIGRYPTKLGEYWSCGVPALVYDKIGDTQELIDQNSKFGLYYFSNEELDEKLQLFNLEIDKKAIRTVAKNEFSLGKGIEFYVNLHQLSIENEK